MGEASYDDGVHNNEAVPMISHMTETAINPPQVGASSAPRSIKILLATLLMFTMDLTTGRYNDQRRDPIGERWKSRTTEAERVVS